MPKTEHTLGGILMRLELMSRDEFNSWLVQEGYTPAEIDQIRTDVIARRKGEKNFSYGKVY